MQTCPWNPMGQNPEWTHSLVNYLSNHIAFHIKLFFDSTIDATRQDHPKLTAKDRKVQQYAIFTKHIFASEAGHSLFYLQDPGRYSTVVKGYLQQYIFLYLY
jgi:hypothetical protein